MILTAEGRKGREVTCQMGDIQDSGSMGLLLRLSTSGSIDRQYSPLSGSCLWGTPMPADARQLTAQRHRGKSSRPRRHVLRLATTTSQHHHFYMTASEALLNSHVHSCRLQDEGDVRRLLQMIRSDPARTRKAAQFRGPVTPAVTREIYCTVS